MRDFSLPPIVIASLFCGLAAASCKSSEPGEPTAGGHTNWLKCVALADCAAAASAVRCSDDGYCLDAAGERIAVGAGAAGREPAHDAGNAGGATGDAGGRTAGTSTQGAGAGDASGGGASGGGDAAPDQDGGRVSTGEPDAATAAQCSGLPAGCGREPGAVCCDPYPCDGPNFCYDGLKCCGSCQTECEDTNVPPIRIPQCPGAAERCDSTRCDPGQPCVQCPAGQVCLEVELTCGPAFGSTAQCIVDPCAGNTLDCSCARTVCDSLQPASVGWACGVYDRANFAVGSGRAPFMACTGGGICASPDTPIATERGDVPIAELRPGDLVYSMHGAQTVLVPLHAVARTPVREHSVLRITLEDAAVLEVSGPHPTADGRRLDALAVGDALDGRQVVAIERIRYAHPFTYDVLPASDSGAYLAAGVWLGSTLAR